MFTIYDIDKDKFSKVEEPDPSLTYTYADYLKWNFEERLELIRGHIFKMSPAPAPIHQEVSGNIYAHLHTLLKKKKCKIYSAPFDIRLPVKNKTKDDEITTVVQPDICIICDTSKIDGRGCCGAPDLVVEILSPGNSHKEVKLKFELYEEAGIKEYWIVNPVEANLVVFILDEKGKYEGGKMYSGKDKIKSYAIPGLVVGTKEMFTR